MNKTLRNTLIALGVGGCCIVAVALVTSSLFHRLLDQPASTRDVTVSSDEAKTPVQTKNLSKITPFSQAQLIGDGKVSALPKKGYVYSCSTSFRSGGASHSGDWIEDNKWNPAKKISVQGSVSWPNASVVITSAGSIRTITSNDLPDHPTGIFPISSSDPAYAYDTNPNGISAQQETYDLPLSPTIAATPSCTSLGTVGIMSNGVLLFNALDDAGRDAVAHEVQDSCEGHPQKQQAYHYHGYSSCFKASSASTVIGYALDGFGITGPKKDDGSYYTTNELDECHGTTSQIIWNTKKITMYHYVMTADYPYSIGCFEGSPISKTPPSGPPPQQGTPPIY